MSLFILLYRPQLGSNIGMVARAMLNCGLSNLRLIAPKEPWPNANATAAAVGADEVLEGAEIFENLDDAVADLGALFATTARPRFMQKPTLPFAELPQTILQSPQPVGILFGGESCGLPNEALKLADALIHIPVNPAFSSLNLAQAVFAVCHHLWCHEGRPGITPMPLEEPAPKAELQGLMKHLEEELDAVDFFYPEHKRERMVLNLRTFLARSKPTLQEVRTLRGVIRALVDGPTNSK